MIFESHRGSPEVTLWRAVIARAVMDATMAMPAHPHQRSTAALDQHRARIWLLNGDEDFCMVCEMANFEPSRVRTAVELLCDNGWPAPRAEIVEAALGVRI
jgi:hypothetical protein